METKAQLPTGRSAVEARAADASVLKTLGADRGGSAKRWIGRAVVLLVVAGLVAGGVMTYRRVASGGPRPTYRTAAVHRGSLVVRVIATGRLEPVNSVQVGAEVSGRVTAVHADYNDHVTLGQVLVEIDASQTRATVDQATAGVSSAAAAIAQAEAVLAEARQARARIAALIVSEAATPQQVEQAESAVARAEASVAAARAQARVARASLSVARTTLGKAVIRSPMDGIVLSRNVEPGQTVISALQSAVLFTLAEDLSRMELHVDVDEADIGRVREGQRATFTVDAYPGRPFPARIVSLRNAPQVVQNVVTYEAVLAVDNHERLLRPGMTATATITTETRDDALLVSNAALRFIPPELEAKERDEHLQTGGRRAERVWVLQQGRPVAVEVTVGPSDGRSTEVVSGNVRVGTQVLVDVARPGG